MSKWSLIVKCETHEVNNTAKYLLYERVSKMKLFDQWGLDSTVKCGLTIWQAYRSLLQLINDLESVNNLINN